MHKDQKELFNIHSKTEHVAKLSQEDKGVNGHCI